MGRFSYEEADNYGNSNKSSFFQLQNDKDTAQVRFMYNSMKDVVGYAVHEVTLQDGKKRYVNCLRDYTDPKDVCPFCARGNFQKAKLYIPLYDEESGEVKIWERGKKMFAEISSICSRYSSADVPLVANVFEIERRGKPKETTTTYGIYPISKDDTRLEDLPEVPEILGRIVLDKSAQEMEYFIQRGEFPESSEPATDDRRGATTEEFPRRTPRNREAF